MAFNKGDKVKLKEPIQGRYHRGRISKIEPTKTIIYITVTLPNGYCATFNEDLWELDNEVIDLTE